MKIKKGIVVTASACALLVCASGCAEEGLLRAGLGLVRGEAAAPPLTKAKFVARANGLCEKGRVFAERNALGVVEDKAQLYVKHHNLDQMKGFLRRQEIATMLAPALKRRAQKVRMLGIPEADKHRVGAILRVVERKAVEAEENPFYFLAGGNPMEDVRTRARAYGIESCAVLYDRHGLYQEGTARAGVRLIPRSSK